MSNYDHGHDQVAAKVREALDSARAELEKLLEKTKARRESLRFDKSQLATDVKAWFAGVEDDIEALLKKIKDR